MLIQLNDRDREKIETILKSKFGLRDGKMLARVIDDIQMTGSIKSFGFGSLIKVPIKTPGAVVHDATLEGYRGGYNCAFRFYGAMHDTPSLMFGLEEAPGKKISGVVSEIKIFKEGQEPSVQGILDYLTAYEKRENPKGNSIYRFPFLEVKLANGEKVLAVACETDPDGKQFIGNKLSLDEKAILIANEWAPAHGINYIKRSDIVSVAKNNDVADITNDRHVKLTLSNGQIVDAVDCAGEDGKASYIISDQWNAPAGIAQENDDGTDNIKVFFSSPGRPTTIYEYLIEVTDAHYQKRFEIDPDLIALLKRVNYYRDQMSPDKRVLLDYADSRYARENALDKFEDAFKREENIAAIKTAEEKELSDTFSKITRGLRQEKRNLDPRVFAKDLDFPIDAKENSKRLNDARNKMRDLVAMLPFPEEKPMVSLAGFERSFQPL